MFVRRHLWLIFQSPSMIVIKEPLKLVTIGAVAAEGIFIEQTLDAAPVADLVGDPLRADRPTHLAVPAAAENHGGSGHTGCQQAHRPQPPGTLVFLRIRVLLLLYFHHRPSRLLVRI